MLFNVGTYIHLANSMSYMKLLKPTIHQSIYDFYIFGSSHTNKDFFMHIDMVKLS